MQIVEGDIIRTIRDNIQHIGHLHTAGNPGCNALDEMQERGPLPFSCAQMPRSFPSGRESFQRFSRDASTSAFNS